MGFSGLSDTWLLLGEKCWGLCCFIRIRNEKAICTECQSCIYLHTIFSAFSRQIFQLKEIMKMQTETGSSKVSVHAFQQHILKLNSFALRKFLGLWILEFNNDSVTSKVEWDHESYWEG